MNFAEDRDQAGPAPFGSACFGRWFTDRHGLPAYAYTLDQRTDPRARQVDLDGSTAAWSTIGNDRIVANAYTDGYVQLWSHDRMPQWLNRWDPERRQYAGGFGYLTQGARTDSTLFLDLAADAAQRRTFGVGYAEKLTTCGALTVTETTYAPFGDLPCVVREVALTNQTDRIVAGDWYEYWGVNPVVADSDEILKPTPMPRTCRFAVRDAQGGLRFEQDAFLADQDPFVIWAAPLTGEVAERFTDSARFFGSGTRSRPGAIDDPGAPPWPGCDAAVFRCPYRLEPLGAIVLRFAVGASAPGQVEGLLDQLRSDETAFAASQAQWRSWLPRVELPPDHAWLAREVVWSAYQVRAATVRDEVAGRHLITQGGYYQYAMGRQIAFRDPLMYALPMCVGEPWIARDTLLYSLEMQDRATGATPFGKARLSEDFFIGDIGDADAWLLLAAVRYVFTTRDFGFLSQPARYRDGSSGPAWEHLRLAFEHQESFAEGPHGHYTVGPIGDWADFAPQFIGLTESSIITAHLAYVYPQLAALADRMGDDDFAARLRGRADALRRRLADDWSERGWFRRGYAGDTPLGEEAIYGDAQAWTLLAGVADAAQSASVVRAIRRHLTGVGAPSALGGPSRIGSSQSPAAADPEIVPEITPATPAQVGDGNAVYFGGTWYAVNGWLTWALSTLDLSGELEVVAWDELKRNTLAVHSEAFPESWSGVLSTDDVCWSFYSSRPEACANGYIRDYNTQNTHPPTWLWLNFLHLAGWSPTARGFAIRPRIPFDRYAISMPRLGLWRSPGAIGGHIHIPAGEAVELAVSGWAGRDCACVAEVDGVRIDARPEGDALVFELRAGVEGLRQWSFTADSEAAPVEPISGR